MRSVNFRFIAITFVCLLLVGGGVHAVHVMQFGNHVSFLKQLADQARESGDSAAEINHYRRYVRLKRDDADAYERLAELLMETGRPAQAHSPLQSAFRLREAEGDTEAITQIRRSIVKAALDSRQQSRLSDAEYQLEMLKEAAPGDPDLLEYQARCHMYRGQWIKASEVLQELIENDPRRVSAYASYAVIALDNVGDAQSAVETLNDMVSRNPDSAEAFVVRGSFRLSHVNRPDRDVHRAEAWLQASAASDSNSITALEPEELLELAAADAEEAVQLLKTDGEPSSDAEAAEDATRLRIEAYTLAMECAQTPRNSGNPDRIRKQHEQAKEYARKIIALCEEQYLKRVQEVKQLRVLDGLDAPEAATGTAPDLPDAVDQRVRLVAFKAAVPAYRVLANLALREGDTESAVTELNGGLKSIGSDETLLLNLARIKLAGDADGSSDPELEKVIARLAATPTTEPLAQFLRARQSIGAKSFATALEDLTAVRGELNRWPDAQVEADTWIGNCYLALGQPEQAQTAYSRALNTAPIAMPARLGLARALEATGKESEAIVQYEMLMQRVGELSGTSLGRELADRYFRLASKQLGRNQASEQRWNELLSAVEEFSDSHLEDPQDAEQMLILRAKIEADRGRLDRAAEMIKEAADSSPRSVALWVTLSQIYDALGDFEAANAALHSIRTEVVEPTPEQSASLVLAEAQHAVVMEGKEAAGKLREFVEGLQDVPASGSEREVRLSLLGGLGEFALLVGDLDTARRAFQQIRAEDPDNVRIRIRLFDLALSESKDDDENQEQQPAQRRKRLDLMNSLLREIEAHAAQTAMFHYGSAVYHLVKAGGDHPANDVEVAQPNNKDYSEALKHLAEAARLNSRWGAIPFLQGETLRRQGNDDQAATAWLSAYDKGYRRPRFVARLILLLYQVGKIDEAAEILVSLEGTEVPKFIELAQAAAAVSVAVMDDDLPQSQQLVELAGEFARESVEDSENPAHHLAFAQILLMKGNVDEAELELEHVRRLKPTDRTIWLRVLQAYQTLVQSGRMSEEAATEKVRLCLRSAEDVLEPGDLALVAVQSHWMLGERDRARELFRNEIEALPADLANATPAQIEVMRRAAEFYVQEPAESPERSQAEGLLRRLHEEGGQIHERLREDRLAAQGRAQSLPTELETTLAANVPVARRLLAGMLLSQQQSGGTKQALELIGANANDGISSIEDRRLEVMILTRSPSIEQKREAMSKLRDLVSVRSPRDEDRLLLATLSLAEYQRLKQLARNSRKAYGDAAARSLETDAKTYLAEARSQTTEILLRQSQPGSAGADGAQSANQGLLGVLMLHVNILLQNNATVDAEQYLAQMRAMAPDANPTAATAASLEFATGDHQSAIETLLSMATAEENEARDAQLAAIAKLLESYGELARTEAAEGSGASTSPDTAAQYFGEAERVLQQLAQSSAESQLTLAGFYGRRGRAEESLALLEAHFESAAPEAVAGAASQVMSGAGRSVELMDRLHNVLTAARDQYPDQQTFQLLLADLYGWRKEFKHSEELYRSVLAESPKHVVAANNLAFLLACQKADLDEALELISTAIAVRGEVPELVDTRAFVLLQRGDLQPAVRDLEKIVRDAPQSTYAYHLARAKLAAGQRQAAQDDWKLALKLDLSEDQIHPAERAEFTEFSSQIIARQ